MQHISLALSFSLHSSCPLTPHFLHIPQELRDVQTGAWVADPALAASTGYKGARTRTMSYIKPLRIPLPMAPKQCGVVEVSEMHGGGE